MFFKLAKEIWRGKSLGRSLVNLRLAEKDIVLSGKVLDLGSTGKASYLRFLKLGEAEFLRLDIEKNSEVDCQIDFEKDSLPFADNSIDYILCFNLLEHIYNGKFLAGEMRRVLRPGGYLVGSSPFLARIHPDPKDFFRYSSDSLRQMFQESGFEGIVVENIGFGPFSAHYAQIEFILPRICRLFCVYFYSFLDRLFLRFRPYFKDKFPLDYLFIARKQ